MKNDFTQQAIEGLVGEGWLDAGVTAVTTCRLPTTRSPVFGGVGGELVTTGGRKRLAKGSWFVTVGPRTVNFYKRSKFGPTEFLQAKTKDLGKVLELARYCDERERERVGGIE